MKGDLPLWLVLTLYAVLLLLIGVIPACFRTVKYQEEQKHGDQVVPVGPERTSRPLAGVGCFLLVVAALVFFFLNETGNLPGGSY
jgi:hypothetical protein